MTEKLISEAPREIKSKWRRFCDFLNDISDLTHTVVAIVAIIGLVFAYYVHQRDKSLFVAQNRPMIDVTPIEIYWNKEKNMTTTVLSINNYSLLSAG